MPNPLVAVLVDFPCFTLFASSIQREGQVGSSASLRPTPTPNQVERYKHLCVSSCYSLMVSFPFINRAKKAVFLASFFRAFLRPCLRELVKTVGCGVLCGPVGGLDEISRYGTLAPEREKQDCSCFSADAPCSLWDVLRVRDVVGGRSPSIPRPITYTVLSCFFVLLVVASSALLLSSKVRCF